MPAASGPRYIGAYGGNGSISARFDFIRFTPETVDGAAPTTSHTLAPAAPDGAGGWYRSPVEVTLAAGRRRRVRVGRRLAPSTGSTAGRSRRTRHRSASRVTGTHTVEYRSVDKAGNTETAKSVTVKLDATAPVTTAALDPSPAPARTPGPVPLTLSRDRRDVGRGADRVPVNTAVRSTAVAAPRFAPRPTG